MVTTPLLAVVATPSPAPAVLAALDLDWLVGVELRGQGQVVPGEEGEELPWVRRSEEGGGEGGSYRERPVEVLVTVVLEG